MAEYVGFIDGCCKYVLKTIVNKKMFLKLLTKKIIKRYRLNRRRKISIDLAKKHTNSFVLSKKQVNEINTFYNPYIKVSSISHNYYTEKTGFFYKEYIPEDIYFCYIDPYFNPPEAAKWIDNKCYYSMLFPNTKMPECVALRLNGLWYVGDRITGKIVEPSTITSILEQQKEVFVKVARESYGGKGVKYLCKNEANYITEFWDFINNTEEDIVVQKVIVQHPELSTINPSSVNTLRFFSILYEKEVKIYSIILRMGIHGAKVDNASSGGITCGVELDGKLKHFGYYSYSQSGKRMTVHPTSGIPFDSVVVPSLDKAIEMVKRLHPYLPHFRMVSWDIAIDQDGDPVLIEANLNRGEIDFHQLNNGPLFGEDTEMVLNEVFEISNNK